MATAVSTPTLTITTAPTMQQLHTWWQEMHTDPDDLHVAFNDFTRLCTKSPVRNLTQRSIRTFWSLFDGFSRSKSPVLRTKSILKGYFWCKAGWPQRSMQTCV